MAVSASEKAALNQWLADTCSEQIISCDVIADGLNCVIHVTTDVGREYVVRRPNELRNTPMFVDTQTEFQVLKRVSARSIPVPQPVAVCSDDSILGHPFILLRFLPGDVVPLGSRLPQRYQHPSARTQFGHEVIDTLAQIHALPADQFEEVCETHTLAEQVAADIRRVEEAAGKVPRSFTNLLRVGEWLTENVPETGSRTLVHGDYRPGNILFADAPDGATNGGTGEQSLPQVSGVLDWETPFVGNPLTDIGYLLLRWRDEHDPTPSFEAIRTQGASDADLEELRQAAAAGLAPYTSALGSPTRQQLVHRYEERTDRTVAHLRYGVAYAAFTLAAVWTTLHAQAGGGETGRVPWIDYLCEMADLILNREFKI